jgi:hypothetical protein
MRPDANVEVYPELANGFRTDKLPLDYKVMCGYVHIPYKDRVTQDWEEEMKKWEK